MEQFEEFAAANKVELTATRIPTRSGDAWETRGDTPDPVHFLVLMTATIDGKSVKLWAGEYSQGIGHAERWAKANKRKFISDRVGNGGHGWPMREALEQGPGRGREFRADSNYWEHIRNRYAASNPLKASEILHCLQMDIMGADQNFEDWAMELGYSEDSIRAKDVWESCNKTRRTMRDALGDKFAAFEELEET